MSLVGDERFGVVAHTSSKSETRYFLEQLGVRWYLDFNSDMSQIPDGAQKVPFLEVPLSSDVWNSGVLDQQNVTDDQIEALGFMKRSKIINLAFTNPGSYWYIFGEANRYGYMTGARFAPVFHYFYTRLKIGDPDAKIIGTSLLNWGYTCEGCPGLFICENLQTLPGFQCGKQWFEEFIDSYEDRYGSKPPVDIWAIDVYPLDWLDTPNSAAHADIAIGQLTGMRAYLNTITEYKNTPIWITEIGLHVGYDGWEFDQQGNIVPVGDYHWDKMSDYLIAVLDWLDQNASSYEIEKWFPLTAWENIVNLRPGTGYMGIIFFDGPSSGASLNCLGEIYQARSLGKLRVKCDADGKAVPE